MRVATRRATMSVAPPGAKGTIRVMGRVGNGACCVCAGPPGWISARPTIARVMPTSDRAISKPPRILIAPQPLEASVAGLDTFILLLIFSAEFLQLGPIRRVCELAPTCPILERPHTRRTV